MLLTDVAENSSFDMTGAESLTGVAAVTKGGGAQRKVRSMPLEVFTADVTISHMTYFPNHSEAQRLLQNIRSAAETTRLQTWVNVANGVVSHSLVY